MSICFHVDADPDPVQDWHQNDPDSYAEMQILPQVLYMLEPGKSGGKLTFIHCNANLLFPFSK
jgi:hypothetical protein